MLQFETTHELVTDTYELEITLVHQVDTDSAWEGVAFHSVKNLCGGAIYHDADHVRSAFTYRETGRTVSSKIIDEIKKLVIDTYYRFDTINNNIEIV